MGLKGLISQRGKLKKKKVQLQAFKNKCSKRGQGPRVKKQPVSSIAKLKEI